MRPQNGNALFLILIAVALFAALSYAITQSGRGGGSIGKETSAINAAQVSQFCASLRQAAARLILTGTAPADVDLDPGCAADSENCIFSQAGGGVASQDPPEGFWNRYMLDAGGPGMGFYIQDVGTNTNVSGRDVFWMLYQVSEQTCRQMQKGLGFSADPPDNSFSFPETGAPDDHYNIGQNVIDAQPGEAFACVSNPVDDESWRYMYYHALIEQ